MYKRQIDGRAEAAAHPVPVDLHHIKASLLGQHRRLPEGIGNGRRLLGRHPGDVGPVSYTHLDVYKRQGFTVVQNKRFDTFTDEMAKITAEAFNKEKNAGKGAFIHSFKRMWETNLQSQDIIKDDCIHGLQRLVLLLEENLRASKGATRTFAIIHTESFIKAINNLIDAQTMPDSAQ